MDKLEIIKQTLKEQEELSKKISSLLTTEQEVVQPSVSNNINKLSQLTGGELKSTVQEVIKESMMTDYPQQVLLDDMDNTIDGELSDDLDGTEIPDLETDLDDIGDIDFDLQPEDLEIDTDSVAVDMRGEDINSLKKVFKSNPNVTLTVADGNTVLKDDETNEEYVIVNEGTTTKKVKLTEMKKDVSKKETMYEIVLENDSVSDNVNESTQSETMYEIVLEGDTKPLNEKKVTSIFKHQAPKSDRKNMKKRTKKFGTKEVYSDDVSGKKVDRQVTGGRTKRVRSGGVNTLTNGDNTFNKKVSMKKEAVNRVDSVLKENKRLKGRLNDFQSKLPVFESKMGEYELYNTNLTYALKLISENTCTADEKTAITQKFSEMTSIEESKQLFKRLSQELQKTKPIIQKESLKTNLTESKETVLTENKNQVKSSSLDRIKQIMNHK